MIMRKLIYFSIILILAGCSGSPSSRTIENKIEDALLQKGFDQVWTIDRVDHINGIMEDDIHYTAIAEYDVTFKLNFQEFTQTDLDLGSNSILGIFESIGLINDMAGKYGQWEAGDRFTSKEEFSFIKMDKGWELTE